MKDRLLKLLGFESGDEFEVLILLTQSVFLGIFLGAFDIGAYSLFLSIFDEKMMARGYIVSGLAGIILTILYTRLQARIIFRNFATGNMFFVTFLTLILWLLLFLAPSKWIIFLVFIMLGPLNILVMLGFRGTMNRLFVLHRSERLSGLADAGLIIGIIISCYAIPVLISLNFRLYNILLLSAAAVMTGSFLQIEIGKRLFSEAGISSPETGRKGNERSVLKLFREDPYLRIMGLFVSLSVMTAFFVQYSFMAVTRELYPAKEDLARFLGLFTGSMMIFTLMIKLFVIKYVVRNYGIRNSMALSPVLIAVFTVIALITAMIIDDTRSTIGFMLFFILLALSRLFSRSLKESIESTSLKVISQTIDIKIRNKVKSAMDGIVNEITAFLSGLLLTGIGILSFIKLIHFSLVLFIITLLWIFIAVKLYSGYRKSIRKALKSGEHEKQIIRRQISKSVKKGSFSVSLALKDEYYNLIADSQASLIKKDNLLLINQIIEHADKNKDVSLLPALKIISSGKGIEDATRERSAGLAESLELLLTSEQQKEDKILTAQKILSGSRQPQTAQILRLLRDNSNESKRLAIYMIGKFRLTEMITEVCGCLKISGLETDASNVLKSFGKDADEVLVKYYLVSSGNLFISKAILNILSKNCRMENLSFIYSRLWSGSRLISETAAERLLDCGYKPVNEEKDRLHQLISDIIGIMVWNLSARICLERNNETLTLGALNREIERWNTFLFNLLSIAYDQGSISMIWEKLRIGTFESVNYALEMIDMVIDNSIKPRLIMLLDLIPDEDKVKNLNQFYSGEIPDKQKLTEDIINRNYNILGIWIRACAIRNLPDIENSDLSESLTALLFSPETILSEESAKLIARSDSELYRSVSVRIPEQLRRHLDNVVSGVTDERELLYEKVRFLSSCFSGLIEEDLIWLAGKMLYSKEMSPGLLTDEGGYILWKEDPENAEIIFKTRATGSARSGKSEQGHFYFLPLRFVEEYNYQFPEKSFNILDFIEINEK